MICLSQYEIGAIYPQFGLKVWRCPLNYFQCSSQALRAAELNEKLSLEWLRAQNDSKQAVPATVLIHKASASETTVTGAAG